MLEGNSEGVLVKVAAIQHDIVWEEPEANFAALAPKIADAAGQGARLVALSEMFSNGFSMNTGEIAEPVGGPSSQFLQTQATEHGIWICGSLPERSEGDSLPRNTLVLAGPDGQTHRYAKKHRFAYGGEDDHYLAGDETLTVDIDGVAVTLLICFDLRFAPDFWNAAEQTDLYVVVANWPGARSLHWLRLLQARAIENLAYVVGVNRVGDSGGLPHTGDSRIFGPFGEPIAEAEPGAEVTLFADIDPETVKTVRADYPFLGERLS